MSAEIMGDLFMADGRKPAWHDIMNPLIEADRHYTASEVYAIFGSPTVRLAKLQTIATNKAGEHIDVNHAAIIRAPMPSDPEPRVYGVVGPDYVVVSPEEIVELWDAHVKRHVETMMFLREGKLMVITAKLEGFSVGKEDVETYVQLGNWMDGASASTAIVSGVCTVCMNTWRMANSAATESYRFVHDREIKTRMGNWFEQIIGKAEKQLPLMKQAMEILTNTRIGSNVAEAKANALQVLTDAYPYPKTPVHDTLASDEWNLSRLEKYELAIKVTDERRVTALEMFQGRGTGMTLPTRKGTLWGLYQGVVETEDFRKGARGDGLASSVLYGERALCKDRALKSSLAIAGVS